MPWLMQFSNAGRSKIAGGQDVQRVEPAAGLADVLDDEVRREVVQEPVLVLERARAPGRTTSSPSRTTRRARRRRGASSTCPVGSSGFGRVSSSTYGPVQVGVAVAVPRQPAEVALELLERAVDVDPRVRRVVGLPHRHRRAPEPVAGDRPVAGVLQPLAELAVLGVLGHPVDLLVELEHPLLERGHLDEPRRDALVDQRLPAAPAVRVGVVVGLAAQQHRARRDRPGRLAVLAVAALRWSMICRFASKTSIPAYSSTGVGEPAVLADRHHRLDALAVGDHLVVLTEGAGGVHQPGAVGGGDELVAGTTRNACSRPR